MSIQYSDTTTKKGLVQFYEKEIGANYGDVSGDTTGALLEFTSRVNVALDNYLLLWAKSAGTWQADDINFTDFQVITSNIISGRRDYAFTNDGNSNRVIDVSKVVILPSATATQYVEIFPVNELNTPSGDNATASNILVNTVTGVPFQYGKMGNSILLDPVPNYSVALGIKMVVNREGSYMTSGDTTKVIGVPVYHEYFYLKPAYDYACIHSLPNLAQLEKKVLELEGNERLGITGKIQAFFGSRERDTKKVITNKKILYI